MSRVELYQGNCLDVLKTLEPNSVDCCVTSPPYWGQRNYNCEGQLGLEKTFQEYIGNLIKVFGEVKRVLKKTGTLFVVIDDSYSGSGKGIGSDHGKAVYSDKDITKTKWNNSVPPKSLCAIPARFQIAMIDQLGFINRNVPIWWKRNAMPESATDRFTNDYEFIYFFSKSGKYYFEQQFDEYTQPLDRWSGNNLKASGQSEWDKGTGQYQYRDRNMRPNDNGKNKRTVWDIPTQPCSEPHFATYPEDLIIPMIKSGCPQFICNKCGKAREKIYNVVGKQVTESMRIAGCNTSGEYHGEDKEDYESGKAQSPSNTKRRILESMSQIKEESLTDCGCNSGFHGGIVLDPFSGIATTGVVAKKLGCGFIGVELNEKYAKIGQKRLDSFEMLPL